MNLKVILRCPNKFFNEYWQLSKWNSILRPKLFKHNSWVNVFHWINDFFMFFPESARPSNDPSVGKSTDFWRGPLTVFILHCKKHLQSILQISACCSYSQQSGKFWAHASQLIRMAPGRWMQTMDHSWPTEALWFKTLKQNSWSTREGSWFFFAHLAENCRNAWNDSQIHAPALEVAKVIRKGNMPLERQPVCPGQG